MYIYLDSDQGLNSLYEFIYSCRDSYNSTYPNLDDQSFINSLEMLKRLKTEVDKGVYNILIKLYDIIKFYYNYQLYI